MRWANIHNIKSKDFIMKTKKYFFGNEEILVGVDENHDLHLDASKLANIMGYKNSSEMPSKVFDGDKDTQMTNTLNGHGKMSFVREDRLRDLLELSDTYTSKSFKNWLNSNAHHIRMENSDPSQKETTKNALKKMIMHNHIQLEESIKEDKDYGWWKESVTDGNGDEVGVMRTEEGLMTISDYAKLLSNERYTIEPIWLYDWLLEHEYIYCSTKHSIVPNPMYLGNNHLGYVGVANGYNDGLESERVVTMISLIGQLKLAYAIIEEIESELDTCFYSSENPKLLPRWMQYTCLTASSLLNEFDKYSYRVVFYEDI